MMFIHKCLTYVFSGSAIQWLPDEGAKGLVAKKDRPICSPPGVSVDMTMSTNPDPLFFKK